MMKVTDVLSVEGNVLKDREGTVIVTISQELGLDVVDAYAHAFAVWSELLNYMKNKLTHVEGYNAFRQERTVLGHRPYTDISFNSGFADWIKNGIQAVALAEGEDAQRNRHRMTTKSGLRPLSVKDGVLIDDVDQAVAVLSKDLDSDAMNAYAHAFAASVELLDIIDFKSGTELAQMKKEYGAAQEFNKHEGLPSSVAVLGVSQPYIPDELEKARRLVAKAKGKEYKEWA